MGVLSNVGDYLHEKSINAVKATDEKVVAMSVLNNSQIVEIEKRKEAYLNQLSALDEVGPQDNISRRLGAIGVEVYQAYLNQLREVYDPVEFDFNRFNSDNRIRYFDITKWVTDAEEQSLDKLVNVYQVLSNDVCNIALIYHRTKDKCVITLGVVNTDPTNSDPSIADNLYSRVEGALRGNFPGSEYNKIDSQYPGYGIGIPESLCGIAGDNASGHCKSVVSVSNVPSDKSEGFISQSMEKLLDGIVPESDDDTYTVVLLARPVRNISDYKNRLYELYTSLSPYSEWQSSLQYSHSDMEGSSTGLAVNGSINIGNQQFLGANFGASFSRAANKAIQQGLSKGYTQSFVNYGVKHTLEIIEEKMKKIEESAALGMWEFSSYFVSDDPVIANNAAHMYLALTQGDNSYLSSAAVNFWDGDIEAKAARVVLSSVQRLQHPVFGLKTSLNDDWLMYPSLVTPSTLVSGRELARALNFPRKSVNGVPVLEVVPFGRNVISYDKSLQNCRQVEVGNIFHMEHEEQTPVYLSLESLRSHAFITGNTGTGKSNTVYHLLEEARDNGIKFLVVEPAKGEYKHVFGNQNDVHVYGTNPQVSPLLRINPFSFPNGIHILEHLDRLVELFNVCWPMYAAMPAVLKSGVEKAYENCGWDLLTSENRYKYDIYPDFADVADCIKEIIDSSEYDNENKGAYKGSLLTRLQSLTNGINGMIFSSDDISDSILFDQNSIVDLSRVGSSETKSLIMGMLVLKLQEHRLIGNIPMNSELRHLTVLEEAHNLLKRTSTEQSNESSSILGKSVEMLANAIAEMRTYGEGFIIADQAPGLMDMSVIRNTNTKVIMRLPDKTDRELVGKAANLNDKQIEELAKLPRGVAAIYQNEWVQPVLCKVRKHDLADNASYQYESNGWSRYTDKDKTVRQSLLSSIMDKELFQIGDKEDLKELKSMVVRSKLSSRVKMDFFDYLDTNENAVDGLRTLLYDFLNAREAIDTASDNNEIRKWANTVISKLDPSIKSFSKRQIELALALLLQEQTIRDSTYKDVYIAYTEVCRDGGGVL